jgi:enoyl-CoA hydratase/carnithine racemase
MNAVQRTRDGELAVVTLARGKVNALNHAVVRELTDMFAALESDPSVRGIVLTGSGKFFTFGFDIPEFLGVKKKDFIAFLTDFTALYQRIFMLPKPVVAGLNGHTVAGGCMLATACDRRVMARGRAKISLNEITFGASVFAGCVATLRACVGNRRAEEILFSGRMFTADEAQRLGLVDRVEEPEQVAGAALEEARQLARQDPVAFRSIKNLLRRPLAEEMQRREPASVQEFADIWYSPATWESLEKIEIRD